MTGHSKAQRPKKQTWLTPDIRRRLAQEAHALGVTKQEYVRLLLSFSSIIRSCLPTEQTLNAGQILALIENPLFSSAFSMLAQTAISQLMKPQSGDATTKEPEPDPQPPQSSQGNALHPYPPRPMPNPNMWMHPPRPFAPPIAAPRDSVPVQPHPPNVRPWSF